MSGFGLLSFEPDYYGPHKPYGANDYMVEPVMGGQKLSPGRDKVLPSHEFWDRYVSTSPAVHDQISRVQSAGLSAINSLGFGLPMALAHRFAPDQAQRVQAVIDANPNEKTVAGIGAAVANPANIGLRAAGNALASRGYGVASQAAADGVTAAGLYSLPDLVKNGGLPPVGGDIPITTAMAARAFMPKLPSSMVERTLRGAQAGVVGQAPEALFWNNPARALVGGVYGAAHGAGGKLVAADAKRNKAEESLLRHRYIENLLGGGIAVSALQNLGGIGRKTDAQTPPIDDPQYPHFARGLIP